MHRPWQIQVYLGLSTVAGPFYRLLLRRRIKQGKEIASRVGERFGRTDKRRPDGFLVWFHAASVGESQALLTPIRELISQAPDLQVLVTTTTRTSAEILSQQLPDRAIHQFSPVDTKQATRAFLDHWQPNLAVWTESEIWPRLIVETADHRIPMHLINARVSPSTAERWQRSATVLRYLLGQFSTIATQDKSTFALITRIGLEAERVKVTGSTKSKAAPLGCDPDALAELRAAIGTRDCWLAASTHTGEEEQVLAAHRALLQGNPNLLLILAPRHPERGTEICRQVAAAGLTCARRSANEPLTDGTQVYLADTIGEMGLWYRLAPISFVGGSLVAIGGHNPFEPIALGSAVVSGPEVYNFDDAYRLIDAAGGVSMISDGTALADAVIRLQDNTVRSAQNHAAATTLSAPNAALEHLIGLVLRACEDDDTKISSSVIGK